MEFCKIVQSYFGEADTSVVIFIEKLVESWKGFLEYITEKSVYDRTKINEYLRLILTHAENRTILDNQNKRVLVEMICSNPSFLSLIKNEDVFNHFEKISKLLNELNIKFQKLDNPTEESVELFEYVYLNNHYNINEDNLLQMLTTFGNDEIEDDFQRSNYFTILNSNCKPLIEYIQSNINSYVKNVYLRLDDNIFEEENSLINLLNNPNLDNKLKKRIIQRVETKVSELPKTEDFIVKGYLLSDNKVMPRWDNVIDYFTAGENVLDEILIKFLEIDDVNETLSKTKLLEENIDFEKNLISCNDFSDETYIKLTNSCYFRYDSVGIEDLSENKASHLSRTILTLTQSNYNLLREHFPNNHINLIEKHFSDFIKNFDDFETDKDDILTLLKSDTVSRGNKFTYISYLEEELIVEHKEISKAVGEIILSKSQMIPFKIDTVEALVTNSGVEERMITLINLYFDNLSDAEIANIVSNVSGYDKLFKKRRPTYTKTDYNKILLRNLKYRGLIKRYYDDKWNDKKYRITTNY